MKLICGLGNPGAKYEATRHNAGFLFVDAVAERLDFPDFTEKWGALYSEGRFGDEKVILLKPQSYMNKSGEPLSRFFNFYKLGLEDLVVVYDDVDLPMGQIRFKEKGSAGTHNGMKSVIACLGSQEFPRLRLGIESRGVEAPDQMDLHSFVLGLFTEKERQMLDEAILSGFDQIEKTLASD